MTHKYVKSGLGFLVGLFLSSPAFAAGFEVFDGQAVTSIVVDKADGAPLKNAAELLARDLKSLSGRQSRIATGDAGICGNTIVIGRAKTPAVKALLSKNNIDATPIAGKWEVYGRAVVPSPCSASAKILVIFGSDTRGAIWGAIDLSREMGVSPWEWWADVKIRKAGRIVVSDALQFSKEPVVKYRGIFLNDEDWGLQPWAAKTYEPGRHNIGPKTYARIFELMWRLKANTIWPAMHDVTAPFNQDPNNAKTADAYAILHGTSHAEPMLRNNVREWDTKERGPFNFLTNRERMLAYWAESVKQNKAYENIYSVGLRGIHDSPMEGVASARGAAKVMEDAIAEQRKILAEVLGVPANTVPQVLTPYKEVLAAYDAGLVLPDDITTVWPDDNHGYIRRLSNAQERTRSGGSGVYYHLSYWGAPMSYLWLATTHPGLVWEEMDKARRFDANRIWIANVGDIKPAEYLTTLFLDMAFGQEVIADLVGVRGHLRTWVAGIFGAEHAEELTDILWRYYDLAFVRKPEHMGWNEFYPSSPVRPTDFNMLDFGDENARRVEAYRELSNRVEALRKVIPADRQDAYFQLVQYPVQASADFNTRILETDKAIAYGLQHRVSADQYAARAEAAQKRIAAATRHYNDVMAGGKWKHMMDLAPNRAPQFAPPSFPKWRATGDHGCALQLEGGQFYDAGGPALTPDLPIFQRGLSRARYVDIFLKAPEAADWKVEPGAPWIRISRTNGRLDAANPEARLSVSIDWKAAPANGQAKIHITCGKTTDVPVGVAVRDIASGSTASFIEESRIVSMTAAHADARSGGWDVLDGLGHSGASLRSNLAMHSIDVGDAAALERAPSLKFRFATSTADEPATLSVIGLPVSPVDSKHGLRLAASLDGGPMEILDLQSAEFSAAWRQNVFANTAIGRLSARRLKPGDHTLAVIPLDPGVIIDRVTVRFDGANASYGPVPETRIRQ